MTRLLKLTAAVVVIALALCVSGDEPKPQHASFRIPAHVNEVPAKDQLRVSVEFSVLIEVIDPPATHGEMIRMAAGKNVMLEVPLYDSVNRSIGDKGVRARVVSP